MIVRPWLFSDIKEILEIEKKCFKDAWSMEMLADLFMSNGFFGLVCVKNSKIIGYIAVKYVLDEAEINIVAVDKSNQRQGVATLLLKQAESELLNKGVKKMFLEVRRSNLNAQALYEKSGYKYIAVREGYYGGLEDALIMNKIL
ncbi:MAG: ribosomal protein S18-alanine N-acetyltransferase [Clostridia bacterium]|nr:ribosomal protein S18-alanine N-acetyltransferase [Clostridia bacterium]